MGMLAYSWECLDCSPNSYWPLRRLGEFVAEYRTCPDCGDTFDPDLHIADEFWVEWIWECEVCSHAVDWKRNVCPFCATWWITHRPRKRDGIPDPLEAHDDPEPDEVEKKTDKKKSSSKKGHKKGDGDDCPANCPGPHETIELVVTEDGQPADLGDLCPGKEQVIEVKSIELWRPLGTGYFKVESGEARFLGGDHVLGGEVSPGRSYRIKAGIDDQTVEVMGQGTLIGGVPTEEARVKLRYHVCHDACHPAREQPGEWVIALTSGLPAGDGHHPPTAAACPCEPASLRVEGIFSKEDTKHEMPLAFGKLTWELVGDGDATLRVGDAARRHDPPLAGGERKLETDVGQGTTVFVLHPPGSFADDGTWSTGSARVRVTWAVEGAEEMTASRVVDVRWHRVRISVSPDFRTSGTVAEVDGESLFVGGAWILDTSRAHTFDARVTARFRALDCLRGGDCVADPGPKGAGRWKVGISQTHLTTNRQAFYKTGDVFGKKWIHVQDYLTASLPLRDSSRDETKETQEDPDTGKVHFDGSKAFGGDPDKGILEGGEGAPWSLFHEPLGVPRRFFRDPHGDPQVTVRWVDNPGSTYAFAFSTKRAKAKLLGDDRGDQIDWWGSSALRAVFLKDDFVCHVAVQRRTLFEIGVRGGLWGETKILASKKWGVKLFTQVLHDLPAKGFVPVTGGAGMWGLITGEEAKELPINVARQRAYFIEGPAPPTTGNAPPTNAPSVPSDRIYQGLEFPEPGEKTEDDGR